MVFYKGYKKMTKQISESVRDSVKDVIDWAACNLSETLTTKILANKSGYSIWHFQQFFISVTGVTPTVYVRYLRMKRARKLLECTNLTFSQIAMDIGYSKQSIFCRNFKKYYAVTPKQFRHNLSIKDSENKVRSSQEF